MKRVMFFLLFLSFLYLGVCVSCAQDIKAEWTKFQEKYGKHLQATWDERTGRPRNILGFIEPKDSLAQLGFVGIDDGWSAILLWKSFIDENERLFGINSSGFSVSDVREIMTERWGILYKVKHQQVYKGVPVECAKSIMFVDRLGRILSFSLLAELDINISAIPSITEAQALAKAQAELIQVGQEVETTARLVILVDEAPDEFYTLAWQVAIYPESERGTIVSIDACNGDILKTYPCGDEFTNSGIVEFHYYTDPSGGNNEPLSQASVTDNMNVKIYSSDGFPVAQQTVYSSNPNYNISWSGGYGVYFLSFCKDGTYAKVQMNANFVSQTNYQYDIGSPKSGTGENTLAGGITSRDFINVYHQCKQMHDMFQAIDPSYNKSKVTVTLLDEFNGGGWNGITDSSTTFRLRDVGSYVTDIVRHEYTHTVICDIYANNNGVGTTHEANTMDEAFATFYAARKATDFYYGDPADIGVTHHDLETPGNFSSYGSPEPYHYSQHDKSKDEHWNQMILASTLWDLIQGGNPNSPPPAAPHPAGWDTIVWLAINDEVNTHCNFRARIIYWANAWGGTSYSNFATSIFNEHGIPSSGSWAPPLIDFQSEMAKLPSENESKPNYRSALLQNYPNPFNPETWIPYQIKDECNLTIKIYNVSGTMVRKLELGNRPAGLYISSDRAAYWDGKNESGEYVSSGTYFYTIHAGDFIATKKMIIQK